MFTQNIKDMCQKIVSIQTERVPVYGDIILEENGWFSPQIGTAQKNDIILLQGTMLQTKFSLYTKRQYDR